MGVYKGRKPSVDKAMVLELREQGVSPSAIANKLKIGRAVSIGRWGDERQAGIGDVRMVVQVYKSCRFLGFYVAALTSSTAFADGGAYWAANSAVRLLPASSDRSEFNLTISDKGQIFNLPFAWASAVEIQQQISTSIADIHFNIKPNDTLLLARVGGGDVASIPSDSVFACTAFEIDHSKLLMAGLTLGLSSMANRVSKWTRFCVADSDRDGRFDKALLIGAKMEEDRKLKDIDPIVYTIVKNKPIGRSHYIAAYYYKKPDMFLGSQIRFSIFMAGDDQIGEYMPLRRLACGERLQDKKFAYPIKSNMRDIRVCGIELRNITQSTDGSSVDVFVKLPTEIQNIAFLGGDGHSYYVAGSSR